MNDDIDDTHQKPYRRILVALAIIIVLAIVVFFLAMKLDLAETVLGFAQTYEAYELDELIIVGLFLAVALALFSIKLWIELKREMKEHEMIAETLDRANTKLTLLNSITRQDILNQLTELAKDLEQSEQRVADPEVRSTIVKIRDTINRVRRQIKFTKEYQDIGVHTPEWQNISDAISRARVGMDLGKVAFDVEVRKVDVFADRLLEKVFFYMIDNAIRHGGPKLTRIHFYDRMQGDELVVICEDDGVGIPPEKKAFLFPEGYGKHFGYGLFLIKEILSITNIRIRETGLAGKGARFEIHIPKEAYRKDLLAIVK